MITILLNMTVKAGLENDFVKMAKHLTEVTRAEDDGCLNYTFHQQADDPQNFVLYEQWQDMPSLSAHLKHLVELLGEPAEGENLPEALMQYLQSMSPVRYDIVA